MSTALPPKYNFLITSCLYHRPMLRHVAKTAPRLAARSRQASTTQTIMWTHTDEAPALASYALLPLVSRFAKSAGIEVQT